jgi:hypothetical protein
MADGFMILGGYLNLVAGLLLFMYWYAYALFLPYGKLTTTLSILVINRNWVWINALGVAGALAGLLGQAAILVIQAPRPVWHSTVGFYVAVTGTALLVGTMLWETVLWPILHVADGSLLDFQGPIYSNRAFLGFFIASTSFRNPSRTRSTNLRPGSFVRQVSGLRPVGRDHVDERRSRLACPRHDLNLRLTTRWSRRGGRRAHRHHFWQASARDRRAATRIRPQPP